MNNFQTGLIASNIIAPSIGVTIFSVFFIIYAYSSFLKYRKREFGLFMILGMTNFYIIKMIVFEICMIAVVSILLGLISGTLFSPIFYYLVIRLINIKGISFSLTFNSYIYSIIFFLTVFVLLLIYSVITSLRCKIINLLKQVRVKDNNFLSHPVWGIMGIIIIGLSFFDILHNFNGGNSIVLCRSFCASFVGVYLCISNISSFFSIPLKWSKKLRHKYMLFITNLKYTLGQTKKILFIITLIASITIFFTTISVIIMSQSQKAAIDYNPYDIAYIQTNNMNNISNKYLDIIVKNGGGNLISNKTLEFIQINNCVYLSDKNLSMTLGYKLPVKKGYFISLYQIVKDDGYKHNIQEFSNLDIPIGNNRQTIVSQGKKVQVLFNRLNYLEGSYMFILNDSDYLNIKSSTIHDNIGTIKLLNFQNWRNTNKINDDLNTALKQYNKEHSKIEQKDIESANYLNQSASKIGDYNKQVQSASFLLFLCGFVGILFFVSSAIMLHFKLLTEFEAEKIKYKKINKIGILEEEISEIVSRELLVLFFVPIMLSILLAVFYSYCFPIEDGKGIISTYYSIVIGLIYLGIQTLYYYIYKRIYIRKLINVL
jgi:putative ABC transport system permease protein